MRYMINGNTLNFNFRLYCLRLGGESSRACLIILVGL